MIFPLDNSSNNAGCYAWQMSILIRLLIVRGWIVVTGNFGFLAVHLHNFDVYEESSSVFVEVYYKVF